MKTLKYLAGALMALSCTTGFAQNQEPESMESMAEKAADELARQLNLDDYQIFRVDSTFLHDYKALNEEIAELRRSQATNPELYFRISDYWGNRIDSTFRSFFTDEQWKSYMKTELGREKRARDKRIAKRQEKEESGK